MRIGQTIVGEDKVYPERKLAIPGENTSVKIEGIEVKDPTFGMDAVWILQNDVLGREQGIRNSRSRLSDDNTSQPIYINMLVN